MLNLSRNASKQDREKLIMVADVRLTVFRAERAEPVSSCSGTTAAAAAGNTKNPSASKRICPGTAHVRRAPSRCCFARTRGRASAVGNDRDRAGSGGCQGGA